MVNDLPHVRLCGILCPHVRLCGQFTSVSEGGGRVKVREHYQIQLVHGHTTYNLAGLAMGWFVYYETIKRELKKRLY